MNREQLAHTTGIDSWLILPVEDELMVNAELYYAEGITFGLQNENLLFIEALGLEDPDGSGDIVTVVEEPITNSTRSTPLTSSGDSQIDNALLLMFSSYMRINAEVESARVSNAQQSDRLMVLCMVMWGLGLS